jgi:hypothetical protein
MIDPEPAVPSITRSNDLLPVLFYAAKHHPDLIMCMKQPGIGKPSASAPVLFEMVKLLASKYCFRIGAQSSVMCYSCQQLCSLLCSAEKESTRSLSWQRNHLDYNQCCSHAMVTLLLVCSNWPVV